MSRQAHYENGIIRVPSKYSVPETIRRLVRSLIESAGFEAIDAGPLQNARSL
jgi:hypothetical protein